MTNKNSSHKPLQDAYTASEACVWIVASLAMDAEKGLEDGDDSRIVADFDDLKELRDAAVLALNDSPQVAQAARRASIDMGTESPRLGLIVAASSLELGTSIALNVLVGMDEYADRMPNDPWKAGGTPAEFAERCKAAITRAHLGSPRRYERLAVKIQREYELARGYFGMVEGTVPRPEAWEFHPGGYAIYGTKVSLEGKLLALLKVLVEARGPVTLEQLQAGAWERDNPPTEGAVQSHLTRLRQHLRRRWGLGNEVLIRRVDRRPALAYEFDHATFNRFEPR